MLDGRTPERTHDLRLLLRRCVEIDPGFADLDADCLYLTAYAIGPRYPESFFDPQESEAREAIAALERIRARLLPLFPATNG